MPLIYRRIFTHMYVVYMCYVVRIYNIYNMCIYMWYICNIHIHTHYVICGITYIPCKYIHLHTHRDTIIILYEFPLATITNNHKLNGLKQWNLFSHSSGGQKSKIKCWKGWFLLEALRRNLFRAPLSTFGDFRCSWLMAASSRLCFWLPVAFFHASVSNSLLSFQKW